MLSLVDAHAADWEESLISEKNAKIQEEASRGRTA